jgi:hypothetical protein
MSQLKDTFFVADRIFAGKTYFNFLIHTLRTLIFYPECFVRVAFTARTVTAHRIFLCEHRRYEYMTNEEITIPCLISTDQKHPVNSHHHHNHHPSRVGP